MSRTRIGKRVKKDFSNSPSRTKQSMAAATDVNNIMKRYAKTGALTHFRNHGGTYADVTGVDFQTAMDTVINVQEMFMELPAAVRSRFENDPMGFLEFVQNPENADEMAELGLRERTTADPQGPEETPPAPVEENPAGQGGRPADAGPAQPST
jgi:phage internal scaffolding protein